MKRIATAAIFLLLACRAGMGQSNFTGTLTVQPAWMVAVTSGAAIVTEEVGKILEQTHTTGTNGTANSPQMNAFVRSTWTLTSGAERVYNLSALTNSFGLPVALFRVNFISVKASTNNANAVGIGNATDHLALFGDTNQTAAIARGGLYLFTAPDATGIAATGKYFRVFNPGTNSVVYDSYIAGAQ